MTEDARKTRAILRSRCFWAGLFFMLVNTVSQMFGADANPNNPLEMLSFLKGFVPKPDSSL